MHFTADDLEGLSVEKKFTVPDIELAGQRLPAEKGDRRYKRKEYPF
jgi:hypothetical protein